MENKTDLRTQLLINNLRGSHNEFSKLQGILCMNHGWDYESIDVSRYLVNFMMIAQRMDELNREAVLGYQLSK